MSTNLRVKLRETFLNGEAPKPNLRADLLAAFAELIGMTIFIFLALAGVQAALEAPKTETDGPTVSQIQSVAFSFGTAITVGLFVCAPYSGGALNPAVLLCLLITRQMSWMRGALIFIAEIVGAILGAYFANWTTANILQGVNALNPGFNYAQGFFAEMLLTFVLCAVVLFVIVENQEPLARFAPIVVGLTVFMCHMIGTPIDGTSINPARSFGAAVVTGRWANSWIFWFGPLIGGFFATIVYFIHKGFTNVFTDLQQPTEKQMMNDPMVQTQVHELNPHDVEYGLDSRPALGAGSDNPVTDSRPTLSATASPNPGKVTPM